MKKGLGAKGPKPCPVSTHPYINPIKPYNSLITPYSMEDP